MTYGERTGDSDKVRDQKDGEKMRKTNAYLTVYLTLTLAVVLSLCLTLIEGTRRNAFYLESECITDIGLNSVFAEYHRELLDQYNLFAIDTSYGTPLPRLQNTANRLEFYLKKNMSQEDIFLDRLLYRDFLKMKPDHISVKRARMFTDGNGSVFRRRAAEAMWDELNLNLLEEWGGWMETIDSEHLTERDIAEEKHRLDEELKEYTRKEKKEKKIWVQGEEMIETDWITVTVDNPTDYLEKMRRKGILNLTVENTEKLSAKHFPVSNLVESRIKAEEVNQGNWDLEEISLGNEMDETLERFLFQEYVLHYMSHYQPETDEEEDAVLAYQIEYLLFGEETDIENLRKTVNSIFAMREAANTTYLYTDQEKCAIAEGLASLLATLATIPEAADVLKHILLLGWAFAESVYDVKCLMQDQRVPLLKDKKTWFYSLENALNVGVLPKAKSKSGMSYEDYLRVFLTLENKDEMTLRAMNIVEAKLRQTPGNEAFRLDGCADAVEVKVCISSAYGYDCEITRQKGYTTQ